jgi:hypothetical protein
MSTDESQLSQQIDIVTPLIRPVSVQSQRLTFSSPTRSLPSMTSSVRSNHSIDQDEPIFVPITNNINYNNQSQSPVIVNKRRSSSVNACLTEKQKEKSRARHMIPLLCDDHSNTQSNSFTIDTSTMDDTRTNNYSHGHVNDDMKCSTSSLPLFNQSTSKKVPDKIMSNDVALENQLLEKSPTNEENTLEESSIARKLRRSCRSSMSARKSLVNRTQKKVVSTFVEELTMINSSVVTDAVSSDCNEHSKKHPIKSILKRLSPTKPRSTQKHRVIFHDQVKVLVFASPSRRDSLMQPKKKSVNTDESKSPIRMIPRENLPLRKQPISARRLNTMANVESTPPVLLSQADKVRSSKLFHPNDALADWTQIQASCQVSRS